MEHMEMEPPEIIEQESLAFVKPIDEATERGDSDIQQFYRNATVFLTGGTGFIGKQLIEKLFRSCEIKKAFVLIRPKKGKSAKERLQVMLDDPVFGPVLNKKPDLGAKIVGVAGDVKDLRLGISDADWKAITDEVNIIFHVAATVRFDESIREATLINVRGTREALILAKACKNLRSFVHVSTAYCNTTSSRIGNDVFEQFYKSPVPPETMLQLVDTVDDARLDKITASLISDWPNTYTFTKAIAEALVQDEVGNLPVCIVRPSIVLNAYREPLPGWLDSSCIYGPSGIVFGVALGAVRLIFVNNTSKLSFVPVDFVNNATIAAGWETTVKKTPEAKIYHISSTNCGVTFKHVSIPMRGDKIRNGLASPLTIWYCYLIETNNRLIHWILSWLLHYIPGYVIDAVMYIFKLKKPPGLKSFVHLYSKFDKMTSVFEYFLTNEWNFDDTNLNSLWEKMSDTDRKIYNFEIKSIDWEHNTLMWCFGIKKYIVKDGLKGTREAARRQQWYKLGNTLILVLYAYLFWYILSWIWYFVNLLF